MKLPLNHKNELDRQLKDKLHDAKAMPPSFQQLFGKGPEVTHDYSFSKWLRSSVCLLSLASAVFLVPFLSSDTAYQEIQVNKLLASQHIDSKSRTNDKIEKKSYISTGSAHTEIKNNVLTNSASSSIVIGKMTIGKNHKEYLPTTLQRKEKPASMKSVESHSDLAILLENALEENHPMDELTIESVEVPISISKVSYHHLVEIKKDGEEDHLYKPTNLNDFLLSNKSKNELYVGMFGAINNTWILNQNTYGEFDGFEFAYKVDFGYQHGFRIGYQPLRKGWGVEMGYIPVSMKGQKYRDNIQGDNKFREVDLNYSQIPFKLKWRMPFSKLHGSMLNWEIGGAYCHLNHAYQNNDGLQTRITDRFRTHVWQLNLGTSADIYFAKNFFFTIGLQGGISTDINAAGWRAPGEYGKSHNIVLGVQSGISYRFN